MARKIFIFGFILLFSITVLSIIILLAGCVNNFNGGKGGGLLNSENNPRNATVAEAKNFKDGVYVRISGVINNLIFSEWYLFYDATGSISIEIENEVWGRSGINPMALEFPVSFEITGEIDKERNADAVIEVERLKKL